MSNTESEQRQHVRRTMHLPVTCCHLEQKSDTSGFYLGKISDVSVGGVCVRGKSEFSFITGNRLLLLVMPHKSRDVINNELPVELKGEVIWRDVGRRSFGLRFFI